MTFRELIEAIKEKNLSKEQLEDYHLDMSRLYALMQLEKADLEKAEALYLIDQKKESSIATKNAWRATKDGQRLIELDHFTKAAEKLLTSLKSRLYSTY